MRQEVARLEQSLARVNDQAEQRDELARLQKLVREMSAQLAGAAPNVNLARTSLAAVSASSVTGGRALDDAFYGVLNAFDGGQNTVDQVTYSEWVSCGENDPWIRVGFDRPVTLTAVRAAGAAIDRVDTEQSAWGPKQHTADGGELALAAPLYGVTSVVVHFRGDGAVQASELEVLGYVPPQIEFSERQPRIAWNAASARIAAMEAYRQWGHGPARNAYDRLERNGDSYVVTIGYGQTDMCRVGFDGATGVKTFTPLAVMQPVATVITSP